MRRFFVQLAIFSVIACLLVYSSGLVLYYFINKSGYNFLNNADYKVTESIIRSRRHIKVKKLVLGDSVCASLYGECADSIVYCLAATVAITPIGHYLLCANFFENNKEQLPEEVVLILNPLCWTNTMEGGLFYSTFTKNFFNDEFISYLDNDEVKYLNGETYTFLCNHRWYQLTPYIPDLHQTQEKGVGISPVQYKYLLKMQRLCKNNGVGFRLLSGPMRESLEASVDAIRKSDRCFDASVFHGYFESVKYEDDGRFADQLHLKYDCVPDDFFNLYN